MQGGHGQVIPSHTHTLTHTHTQKGSERQKYEKGKSEREETLASLTIGSLLSGSNAMVITVAVCVWTIDSYYQTAIKCCEERLKDCVCV